MNITKILTLLGAIAAGSSAMASTITPQLILTPPAGTWVYNAGHSSGQLQVGDGFAIFDFGGYVSGSISAPAGWTASTQATGSPWGASLGSDSSDINLIFTYSGPLPHTTTTGSTVFGPFSAGTTSTGQTTEEWISQDHTTDGTLGSIHRDGIEVPSSVPDGGATAMLLGVGLLGLGALRRKVS